MEAILLRRIRVLLALFMAGLVLCGLVIFPLQQQIDLVASMFGPGTLADRVFPPMAQWIAQLQEGIGAIADNHPYLFYCTDWVGFAMIAIAITFFGPLKDPVRNIWVIRFGMIVCMLTIPMVIISGTIRGFPLFWLPVDCMFGIAGWVLLYPAFRYTQRLEANRSGVAPPQNPCS